MTLTLRRRRAFDSRDHAGGKSFYALLLSGRARSWAAAFTLVVLIGCATPTAYKTLYAVGHATDAAVKTYLDLVVDGRVRTNDVPKIMRMYDEFQALYRVAEAVAEFNPTARADPGITAKAAALIGEAAKAKGSP